MSGIGLTQVPSQPRPGWLAAAAIVAGLAVVVVGAYGLFNLGGQTGPGGGPTPTSVITPAATSTPTVAPTPRPTRTPTPTLGPGMATGVQTCATSTPGVTTTVNGVVQSRGEVMDCTNIATDPRLSGQVTTTYNWDEYRDGLWLGWGVTEIRNEGGTWSGPYAVTSTSTAGLMEFDAVLIGSGGYEGLELLSHVRVTSVQTAITSRVFEAGPVISGTETGLTVTSTPVEIVVGDITATRRIGARATDTMSDPRVSGERTLAFSIDQRPDDSADLWGTATLTTADGTWEGFWFGTADPGYTTKHIHSLMRGTGAYEGLLFRLEVTGTGDPDYQLTGEIIEGF